MLTIPDSWTTFAGYYLDALDHATNGDTRSRTWPTGDFARKQRAADLAEWHAILIQRLADTEAEDLLDKFANHPALAVRNLTSSVPVSPTSAVTSKQPALS